MKNIKRAKGLEQRGKRIRISGTRFRAFAYLPEKDTRNIKKISDFKDKVKANLVADKPQTALNVLGEFYRYLDFTRGGRWVIVKFDLAKKGHLERFLQLILKDPNKSDAEKADSNNLLKALPFCKVFTYKGVCCMRVPVRFWNWDYYEDFGRGPAFIFMENIVLERAGIPEKFRSTILDHEVREMLMNKRGFNKSHMIAVRRERKEAPKGFMEWLREKYPDGWKARKGAKWPRGK